MAQYLALKAEAGGQPAVLPDGRFLRQTILRGCRNRGKRARYRAGRRGRIPEAQPVPHVARAVHAAEGCSPDWCAQAARVAIAERSERRRKPADAGGSKALVARDIVRFVTAGTLTEDALLEPRRANVLAASLPFLGSARGWRPATSPPGGWSWKSARPIPGARRWRGWARQELVAAEESSLSFPKRPRAARAFETRKRAQHGSWCCTAFRRWMALASSAARC